MPIRKAFTLVEVLVVVLILGVLAVIAIPRLSVATLHRGKMEVAARKIVADLRLARQLAITHAATNPRGYELDMVGHAPYGAYAVQDRQSGTVVASHTIDPAVSCAGAGRFQFGPLGNLDGDHYHDHRLRLSADGKTVTITIVPATGMVQCEREIR